MSSDPTAEVGLDELYKLNEQWVREYLPDLLDQESMRKAIADISTTVSGMITPTELDPEYQTKLSLLAVDVHTREAGQPEIFSVFQDVIRNGFPKAWNVMNAAFRPLHAAILVLNDPDLSLYLAGVHHAIVSKAEAVLNIAFQLELQAVHINLYNGDTPDEIRSDLRGEERPTIPPTEDLDSLFSDFC